MGCKPVRVANQPDHLVFSKTSGVINVPSGDVVSGISAAPEIPLTRSTDKVFERGNGLTHSKTLTVSTAIVGLILVGVVIGVSQGPVQLDLGTSIRALFSDGNATARTIVWEFRMPRVMITLLAGAALGASGVLLQTVTRNPLGDPQIFGVGGGAAVVQAMAMAGVFVLSQSVVMLLSVLASVAAAIFIGSFASRNYNSPSNLALVGVSVAALTAAIATGILAGGRVITQQALFLIGGGAANRTWDDFLPAIPYLLIGLALAAVVARTLNLFPLGDSIVRNLGADPVRSRRLALVAAGVLGGAAVAVTGLIGFVGLLVPHLGRRLVGHDTRSLLIVSVPLGGAVVLFADQIARLAISPNEIPVGMVTAAVGAPLMIYLVWRSK